MSRKSAIMLKGFSLAVSAAMIASVMQIPVYADELPDGRIAIEAGGGQTITEHWGNVRYSGQEGNGVDVTANEGSYAVVTTGKVQTDGIPEGSGFSGVYAYSKVGGFSSAEAEGVRSSACGIKAVSEDEGSRSSIKVEGDIDAKGNGIETKALSGAEADATVEGDVSGGKAGLEIFNNNGITKADIDGDLTGGTNGIDAQVINGGKTTVSVDGDIAGKTQNGVYAEVSEGGSFDLTADGSISGKSAGIVVENGHYAVEDVPETEGGTVDIRSNDVSGENTGIYVGSYAGAETDITVKGNVTGGTESAICANNEKSDTDITVKGDVTSKEGFGITGTTIDGELNITVDGTVSGGKGGVYTADDGSGFTLTVWKIEPDEQGALAFGMNDDEAYVENKAFEQTIQYIIRLDQPTAGATLSVTDKNGNALSKIVSSENTYEYAYEGDTVLLKVDLAEGYDLLGAYNNDGKAMELLKDADGNYYIVVPKGGGVSLSVEVKKAEPKKPDEDDDYEKALIEFLRQFNAALNDRSNSDSGLMEAAAMQGTAATIEAAPVSVRNQLLSKIIDAPTNAHIVFLTNESPILDKEIMDMLEIRRDISLTISYVLQGKRYIVDIPAGYSIDSLRIKEGIYAGQGDLTLKAYSSVEQVSVKALSMP